MKLRLQSRYLLTIVSLVMLTVVSLSMLMMWQFDQSTDRIRELSQASLQDRLEQQIRDRGEIFVSYLAQDVAKPLAELNMIGMQRLIGEALAQPDVHHVYVFDEQQRLVHDGSERIERFGEELGDIGVADETDHSHAEGSHLDLFEFEQRVTWHGGAIGGVRVGMALDAISTETGRMTGALDEVIAQGKQKNWSKVVTISGLFLALSSLAALMISRGLVGPIRRLAEYASAVGHGNYEEPLVVSRHDELGDLARILREMSENLRISAGEVHYLAYHDSLTQLPNRAQLKQALGQALARGQRNQTNVALLFIDLDDFKRVNDTLGHDAGDLLLQEFAVRLRECLRGSDQVASGADSPTGPQEVIARLGGDEFTVVLESINDGADAAVVAGRILGVLREPFILAGQEVVVGASIGVTTYPEDGGDVETLLRNADVAMYQAKERGKNHFEFYNDSMHRMATERLSLETDLRHAIEYDQMRVVYQPVLDTHTGAIRGIEARLRWLHPALGQIKPSVFLPLAEQSGFIVKLDEWTLRRACADLAQLNQHGYDSFSLCVNLGSVHFRDHSLSEALWQALESNGLESNRLVLELNEKTIMRNFPRAVALMSELRERGVGVWVDDFGGGHSPLSQLTKMPVTGLKVSAEHVGQMTAGSHERAVISTIVAMAHSLNLKVTAEGVENQRQIELLREIDCDYVQGSLFLRPMLLDDLITWLERNAADPVPLENTGTFASIPLPKQGQRRGLPRDTRKVD